MFSLELYIHHLLVQDYTFIVYIWTCKITSNPTTQTIQHPITIPMV